MPSNVFKITRKRKLECHLPYLEYQVDISNVIYCIQNIRKKPIQRQSIELRIRRRQLERPPCTLFKISGKRKLVCHIFYSEYRLRTQLEFPLPYSEYHKEHTVTDNRVVLIPMI